MDSIVLVVFSNVTDSVNLCWKRFPGFILILHIFIIVVYKEKFSMEMSSLVERGNTDNFFFVVILQGSVFSLSVTPYLEYPKTRPDSISLMLCLTRTLLKEYN